MPDTNFIFNTYIPRNQYIGNSASPTNLNFDSSFNVGYLISRYSGSKINVTSGCYLSGMGIRRSHTYNNPDFTFNLLVNDNSLLTTRTGSGTSYSIVLYNYYTAALMSNFSASTLTNMSNSQTYDLTDLAMIYIG